AGRVLLAFESLELRQQAPPARLERGELLQLTGQIHAAVAERGSNSLEVFPEIGGINHGRRIALIVQQRSCDRMAPWLARSARPSSPPQAWAPGFFPRPRRSRRRCSCSSTSRSSSTASKRPFNPASTTSSS